MIFQCSIRKSNWRIEKSILVEAGLMTEWQDNTWIRYVPEFHDYYLGQVVPRLTLEDSYTNRRNLIVTAKEFVSIVTLHKLNPQLTTEDLIKTLKLNQRNKWVIEYSPYKHILN